MPKPKYQLKHKPPPSPPRLVRPPRRPSPPPAHPSIASTTPAPTAHTKPDVSNQALFAGAFGAPESGKSHYVKSLIAGNIDAIVFDPGHEYDGFACTTEARFHELVNNGTRGKIVLRPSFDDELRCKQFNRFCLVALAIARARGRCLTIVDELQLVTLPGQSSGGWSELVLTGRKLGVQVIAASIRPAIIDKNFWTVCTNVRCGRLNYDEDQKTMAKSLNVPIDDVKALTGYQFISRNMRTGEVKRG